VVRQQQGEIAESKPTDFQTMHAEDGAAKPCSTLERVRYK
jgi:hypothetical protein